MVTGSPIGGTFIGVNNSHQLDPSQLEVGDHNITYRIVDIYGCSNKLTNYFTVKSVSPVSFTGLSSGYCIVDPMVNLLGDPQGGTGVFYGKGKKFPEVENLFFLIRNYQ